MPDSGRIRQADAVDDLSAALRHAEEYEDVVSGAVSPDESDLWEKCADLLQLLHSRRRFIIRTVVVATLLCAAIAFLLPKRYESTARLMPPDSQMNPMLSMLMGGATDKLPASISAGLLGGKTNGALFVGVLGSRTIEDKLIIQFDLRKVYRDRYWEDARKDLEAHTAILEDKKSGLIAITVTDKDPARAAKMATAYVDELNRLLAQVSTSSARRERMFIEDRLKDVKAELNTAAEKFSHFASKNSTLDIKEQTVVMVGAAADLQGQLIAAQSELQGLEQFFGPENVRVRAVKAKIGTLRAELEKMTGSSDPKSLTAENGAYPSIRKLPLLGVEWANLYRDTKVQEKVLELLTQQYELAKVQEAKEIPTAKLLDEPIVPEKKSWPPRGLIIAAGLMLSFLGSCVWVVANWSWNDMTDDAPQKKFANRLLGLLRNKAELDTTRRERGQ